VNLQDARCNNKDIHKDYIPLTPIFKNKHYVSEANRIRPQVKTLFIRYLLCFGQQFLRISGFIWRRKQLAFEA